MKRTTGDRVSEPESPTLADAAAAFQIVAEQARNGMVVIDWFGTN
jgi:hypothetical protein